METFKLKFRHRYTPIKYHSQIRKKEKGKGQPELPIDISGSLHQVDWQLVRANDFFVRRDIDISIFEVELVQRLGLYKVMVGMQAILLAVRLDFNRFVYAIRQVRTIASSILTSVLICVTGTILGLLPSIITPKGSSRQVQCQYSKDARNLPAPENHPSQVYL